ncbi:MAG TPA: hypothetical protein VMF52_11185 [Steroidobacteraceae bacterium]|nr:hypothetical protein [Steroidobacteraceae bacterium]
MSARIRSIHVAATALLATLAGTAGAGSVYVAPVVIRAEANGGGYAEGGLGYVRNSANAAEYITCTLQRREILDASNRPTRQTLAVTCTARDAAGTSAVCRTASPDIARGLGAATGDAILGFGYDAAGACTRIVVYESASMTPKR